MALQVSCYRPPFHIWKDRAQPTLPAPLCSSVVPTSSYITVPLMSSAKLPFLSIPGSLNRSDLYKTQVWQIIYCGLWLCLLPNSMNLCHLGLGYSSDWEMNSSKKKHPNTYFLYLIIGQFYHLICIKESLIKFFSSNAKLNNHNGLSYTVLTAKHSHADCSFCNLLNFTVSDADPHSCLFRHLCPHL